MPQPSALGRQTEDHQSTSSTGNKPVEKFHDGPVHASIWENDGARGLFRIASFELRYKDSQEQWQTGHSYSASALKHLETAAREARTRIESWQQTQPAKPAPRP